MRKKVASHPSVADDTGTAHRTGIHFLEAALNGAAAELNPTQAAGIALSACSDAHSHGFAFAYVWDAIRLTNILKAARG